MSQSQEQYLRDVLQAMEEAESFLAGLSYEEFAQDEKTQNAVQWSLMVVGEAAKKLRPELREKAKSLPWQDMMGMRDRMVHGYFSIDLRVVWKAVKEDIRHAKPRIQQMLHDLEREQ